MSTEMLRRKFWKEVSVEPVQGGHAIRLDQRVLSTPLKTPLVLPTRALADRIAAEWRAVEGSVNPEAMPFTRAANSAIETVMPQHARVVAGLAEYGASDLLCYRAAHPEGLVARQEECWDPLLDWARTELGAPLICVQGVMHVDQPPASLARLHDAVAAQDAWSLTALSELVTLSGSLVVALAVQRGRLSAEEGWDVSRVDEDWQASVWGIDEEAAERAAFKKASFLQGWRLLEALRA